MIFYPVAPRSEEWQRLRLGIPTSSEFHRILTPKGKPSTQAEGYMYGLLSEWMLGHPTESVETQWMVRGTVLEDSAYAAYEFQTEAETSIGGFFTTDDGMIGCSPDRLVGDRGILEIKCPKHNTQVGYLLNQKVEEDYHVQIQGQLWVSEREWVDVTAYHPELPSVIMRVTRNEDYIAKLAAAVPAFVDVMLQHREDLSRRFGPFKPQEPQAPVKDSTWDFLTDQDVGEIYQATQDKGAK